MNAFKDTIRRSSVILVGLVFFSAGLLKLQDPVGAGLVVKEYFKFFGTDFLEPFSKAIAWALAMLETLVGVALLAGLWRRGLAVITSAMMLFFTVITVILVIKQPVMDCGCFGEAIHLTHEQTLLKNVILCVFCLIAFFPGELGHPHMPHKLIAFVLATGAVVALSIHALTRLPSIDFTDFAPGTELTAAASVQDIDDQRDSLFIYERGEMQGAFSSDKLPDDQWEYIDSQAEGLNIHPTRLQTASLPISDAEGIYQDHLLAIEDVAVISVYSPEKFGFEEWETVASSLQEMQMAGLTAYLLMPDAAEAPDDLIDIAYSADRKTLMTFNRSNGGVTALHDGEIMAKWPFRHSPDSDTWENILKRNPVEYELSHNSKGRLTFQVVAVYSLAILLIM